MSTASSSTWAYTDNRKESSCTAETPSRGGRCAGHGRQEIEEAMIEVQGIKRSNPLKGAWHRCARRGGAERGEQPRGVVVAAVAEWLAARGLGNTFGSEEIERCICDWCRRGGRCPRTEGMANVRASPGGE